MCGYEPPSGYNLPSGCFESDPCAPWNEEDPKTCGGCSHLLEGCCDFGICELEFEEAFEEQQAREPLAAWEAACWSRDWIVDNYKDMQEDTCRRFSNDWR